MQHFRTNRLDEEAVVLLVFQTSIQWTSFLWGYRNDKGYGLLPAAVEEMKEGIIRQGFAVRNMKNDS